MKPIDKIIAFFREEGVVPTNSTASTPGKPGFSSAAPASGPTAGYDKLLGKGKIARRKNTIGLWAGSLKKKKRRKKK